MGGGRRGGGRDGGMGDVMNEDKGIGMLGRIWFNGNMTNVLAHSSGWFQIFLILK